LHADAEQEGADQQRDADREDEAAHRLAEHRAGIERRQEQEDGEAEHDHLRPQPGTTPLGEQSAEGAGEAEGRMEQREAERGAEDQQSPLRRAVVPGQRDRRRGEQEARDSSPGAHAATRGSATPTSTSRVTIAASRAASQPSVPAGRSGSTIQR
jgi:hypothetical protein